MNIFLDTEVKPLKAGIVTVPEDMIAGHSWFGKTAHILRPGGKILRCEILEIILRPCFVGLRVRYRQDGVSKRRNFSPIFLMSMHLMWWSRLIVSDDDVDTTVAPTEETLPPLRLLKCEESKLKHEQKMALIWTLEQTDYLQSLI
jgi:hypothetical protein